ncbi:MAG: histidinol dehydrogenase [Ruminococcaceae bacterium]|nr:histidinol dehydrogenase [Oscillospiraceae bacterium]
MIKIIEKYNEKEIFDRSEQVVDVSDTVRDIINDVRKNGDEALRKYCLKFDKVNLDSFEIDSKLMKSAYDNCDAEFKVVLDEAAANIKEYHKEQGYKDYEINRKNGVKIGRRVIPLERVALYVPGGTAAYPSSVLMNCIPAKIAGVDEIIMTTPPSADGSIRADILAAAYVAGVDRLFCIGGAQAVAALAYGTETVPKVDKIVGPGNAFVAEAKRQVYGVVDIDMIAGPSEILVIADKSSNPVAVAADMLSQAEHDKNASAVMITDSKEVAEATALEIERQLKLLPREEIARASIENNGKIIIVESIDKAIEISNGLAPEHLEINTENAIELLPLVRNAGSVFLGSNCPEAVGDYFSGTNHVLPTSGTARFASALSVEDFIKSIEYTYYPREALIKDADKIALFATHEGLDAHARSALVRKELDK